MTGESGPFEIQVLPEISLAYVLTVPFYNLSVSRTLDDSQQL